MATTEVKDAPGSVQWAAQAERFSLRFMRHFDWALPLLKKANFDVDKALERSPQAHD